MGVRIIYDEKHEQANLYCSTSEWAFGPIFHSQSEKGKRYHSADERCEAFLSYLVKHNYPDPRKLNEIELRTAFHSWLAQEDKQWKEVEI